jgi:hypothetical protein
MKLESPWEIVLVEALHTAATGTPWGSAAGLFIWAIKNQERVDEAWIRVKTARARLENERERIANDGKRLRIEGRGLDQQIAREETFRVEEELRALAAQTTTGRPQLRVVGPNPVDQLES